MHDNIPIKPETQYNKILSKSNQNLPEKSCQTKLGDTQYIWIRIRETTNTIPVNTTTWHISEEGMVTRQPLQHEDDMTEFQTPILSNAGRQLWTFSNLKHVLELTGTVNCKLINAWVRSNTKIEIATNTSQTNKKQLEGVIHQNMIN